MILFHFFFVLSVVVGRNVASASKLSLLHKAVFAGYDKSARPDDQVIKLTKLNKIEIKNRERDRSCKGSPD
jgi:hypothetical protein